LVVVIQANLMLVPLALIASNQILQLLLIRTLMIDAVIAFTEAIDIILFVPSRII